MKGKSLRKLVDTDGKRYQFDSLTFRDELHEYAKEKQMSVSNIMEDIAEEIGVSASAIKQWQTPKLSGPSDMQKVRDVAEYLDNDYHEFLVECDEEIENMNEVKVKTYEVAGVQEHKVYLQNSVYKDPSRVYSEKEAANDILRSVVDVFEVIREQYLDFWRGYDVLTYENDMYSTLQRHMLELPEKTYMELVSFFDTEISCIFGGDSGIDTVFESHIKEEFAEEMYGSKDIELGDMEITFGFLPYLEKRILGRLREIFKDYIPK